MDVHSLCDRSVDIKKWINKSLEAKAPTDSMADHLKQIIGELRYQYETKDQEFERAGEEAIQSIPTVLCEIDRVSTESKKVQKQIEQFYVSLAKIEKETSNSIHLLAEIDTVKDRMESCTKSLHSAELLIKSSKELEKLNSSEDAQAIAKQIQETKANLALLGDIPQFSQTKDQLSVLENRLETIAIPLLRNALGNRNSDDVKVLLGLFKQMDKESEVSDLVCDYYVDRVSELWNQMTNNMQDKENSFGECLGNFYNQFTEILDSQVRWAHRQIPTNYHLLSSVIAKSTMKFETAFQSFLQQKIDSIPNCVKEIINIWNISSHFCNQAIGVISPLSEEQQLFIIDSVFQPFLPFQSKFASIISKRISNELENSILMKPDEFSQTISWMEERIPRMFHLCEESMDDFITFTGGVEADKFIQTLSENFIKFLNNWLETLQFLRVKSKVDIVENNTSVGNNSFDQNFTHDWTFVQGSLQVLRASKLFSSKFNLFDGTLRNQFVTQGNILLAPSDGNDTIEITYFKRFAQKDISNVMIFQERISDVASQLLSAPNRMLVTFDTRAQSFVFDTMFQFIKEKLASVPSLKVWTKPATMSPAGIEMPSFSLSPLGYITQIGEHLFSLPQQLDPFAAGEGDGETDEELDTAFVTQWLSHISSNTMSLYVQKICQIPTLSNHGVKQLITDIEYLCQVLNPFGIQPDSSIQNTLEFLQTSEEEYVDSLQMITDPSSAKLGSIIGRMRGITIPGNLKESQ